MKKNLFEPLIDSLKKNGESELLELKKDNADEKMIVRSISAISNSARLKGTQKGYVLCGLEDSTFNLVGTNFYPGKTKISQQEISNWLSLHLRPHVQFQFDEHETQDGKHLVLLEINVASGVPTEATIEKNPPRAFIRIGSSTKSLDDFPEHKRNLWKALTNNKPEIDLVWENVTFQELSEHLLISEYFEKMGDRSRKSEAEIIETLLNNNLIVSTGPELYGLPLYSALLLCKNLNFFRQTQGKVIRVIAYEGNNRLSGASFDEDFTDGLVSSFNQIYKKILEYTPKTERIDPNTAQRTVKYIVPELAIRELLANAVVHQDLNAYGTKVCIEIFKNKIEISNPGSPLINPIRFLDERPRCRNELLAKEMRMLGYTEDRGSGWDKIVNSIELATVPAPEVKLGQDTTSVILWFEKSFDTLTRQERDWTVYLHTVIKYILEEPANNASLRLRLGLPATKTSTVSKLYKQAIESKLIVQSDENASNKMMRYIPIWAADS